MHLDVVDLIEFYKRPLGRLTREVLRKKILEFWPNVTGDRICGIGYATPYLRPFLKDAERVMAFMPAPQGVAAWPRYGPNRAALVLEAMFALPDSCIDRAVLIHSLEMAHHPRELLQEVWRVLTPGGRLLAVVPNRSGLWARMDSTPFGYGRPFSRGQMSHLLKDVSFSPIGWREALMMPPMFKQPRKSTARTWERLGCRFWPAFSGVIVVEAEKLLHQGIPAKASAARRLSPIFAPQGAFSTRDAVTAPGKSRLG
ncbi:MAG: methyltransferase domain-containing protein [Pseudomonadota bacterium]